MNSTLKGVLIFVLGAAAGSLATWKLIEKKYKDIAQEEIDSVKDTFSKMKKNEYPDKLEDYPDFEEFDDSDDVEEEPKPEQKILLSMQRYSLGPAIQIMLRGRRKKKRKEWNPWKMKDLM